MTCKDIKIERNIVTNTTTVETVSGAFLFNNINFPDNPTTGALHIVKFDNGLYVYEYTNQQWVLKIFYSDAITSGTTEERPEEPAPPSLRFNTTDSVLEYFNGTDWIQLFGQVI